MKNEELISTKIEQKKKCIGLLFKHRHNPEDSCLWSEAITDLTEEISDLLLNEENNETKKQH